MTEISRRRLIAGAGVGATALWIAPAVSTLGSATGATGSNCVVFTFDMTQFQSPSFPPYTFNVGTNLVTTPGTLQVTTGDIDIVGPGTPWNGGGYPTVQAIDLNGSSGQTTTVLTGSVSLPAGSYSATLDVFGSNGSDSNTVSVEIGGTPVISPTAVPGGGGAHTLSGSTGSASGNVTITQLSAPDNQGLFLTKLVITQEDC